MNDPIPAGCIVLAAVAFAVFVALGAFADELNAFFFKIMY